MWPWPHSQVDRMAVGITSVPVSWERWLDADLNFLLFLNQKIDSPSTLPYLHLVERRRRLLGLLHSAP